MSGFRNLSRLTHFVANLNAVLAKLELLHEKKKWRNTEGSLAKADLMACSLLIIFVITRESLGITSRCTQILLLAHSLELREFNVFLLWLFIQTSQIICSQVQSLLCLCYLTPLQQHAPHIIAHYIFLDKWIRWYSQLISLIACVCMPKSHDSSSLWP